MASNSSHFASIENAKDFRYFGNENYPVRPTKAKISLTPVAGGKVIKFIISAVTDQVIFGGEIVSCISFDGVELGSQKFNMSDGVLSLPISVGGDFELNFRQGFPVDVQWGTYNMKMTLLNQDGRQLSCFAFDYTIPFDPTISYTVID